MRTPEDWLINELSELCASTGQKRARHLYRLCAFTEIIKIDRRKVNKIVEETKPFVMAKPHPFSEEAIVELGQNYDVENVGDFQFEKGKSLDKISFNTALERMLKVVGAVGDAPYLKADDDGMW